MPRKLLSPVGYLVVWCLKTLYFLTMSSPTNVENTPVMDMFFCLDNLATIRTEARNYTLKEYSDYYAADNVKKAPNQPNTFEPTRLVRGNHPLWALFYNPGRTRLADDGTVEADPNHPPHFRVSRELLGRMLHTFKKKYVDEDEQRKTSDLLSEHIRRETERLTTNVSRVALTDGIGGLSPLLDHSSDRRCVLVSKYPHHLAFRYL